MTAAPPPSSSGSAAAFEDACHAEGMERGSYAVQAAVRAFCRWQATSPTPQIAGGDVRWAINVLLEKVAAKFEAWDTFDLFRSEAAETVRSFKHDLASLSPQAQAGETQKLADEMQALGYPEFGDCLSFKAYNLILSALRSAGVAQGSPDRGKLVTLIDAVKRLVDRHAETKEGSGILLIPAAPHELKRLRQALEPFRETATLAAESAASPPAALPAGEALFAFFKWAMQEGPWEGDDLYGADVQDKAESLGLIVKTKYDPDKHGDHPDFEKGADFYEIAPGVAIPSTSRAIPLLQLQGKRTRRAAYGVVSGDYLH